MTLALFVGELLSEQSSGRFLAVPALALESTVATDSMLVFGLDAQGSYTIADSEHGQVNAAVSVGARLRNGRVFGEGWAGAGARLRVATFGDYEAFSANPVARVRWVTGYQIAPQVAIRGGVGAWLGIDAVDVDTTVGAAWCF